MNLLTITTLFPALLLAVQQPRIWADDSNFYDMSAQEKGIARARTFVPKKPVARRGAPPPNIPPPPPKIRLQAIREPEIVEDVSYFQEPVRRREESDGFFVPFPDYIPPGKPMTVVRTEWEDSEDFADSWFNVKPERAVHEAQRPIVIARSPINYNKNNH